jgi:HD-like signal output (HDOD) protein
MAVQGITKEQAVQGAIREISHIATLPEITLKIIQLVESPNSTAQELHGVISKDPALCTRILKVVNSAFYGLPGQIASINRAIVLLGLNAVKNIAIAASLAKLFKGGQLTPGFAAKDLWTHAIGAATATRMLASSMKIGLADEAFLSGLLHDVGIMVEMQYDRNRLVEVLEKCEAAKNAGQPFNMLDVEAEVFGANHQDFGAALCEKWKFPRCFANVTGFHHNPEQLPADQRTLATIVSVADRLAASLEGGFGLDVGSHDVPQAHLDELKLTHDNIADIKARLPQQITEAQSAMG